MCASINWFSGIDYHILVLVILGILMITGKFTLITAKLGFLNGLVW